MSQCVRCGAQFSCAMVDVGQGGAACWCTALPAILPVPQPGQATCFCADCLRQVIAQQDVQQNSGELLGQQ